MARRASEVGIRHCGGRQMNSNQFQFAAETVNLSGTKLAPLGESGGTGLLEVCSFVERTLLVEVI